MAGYWPSSFFACLWTEEDPGNEVGALYLTCGTCFVRCGSLLVRLVHLVPLVRVDQ